MLSSGWFGLVADPALEGFVSVEFETHHGLGATAIEGFIRSALQVIVLVVVYSGLERVAEVGCVLLAT